MVNFKEGDKVKIPKVKSQVNRTDTTYEEFLGKLKQYEQTADYLVVGPVNYNKKTCNLYLIPYTTAYTPNFNFCDLELYVEHLIHELW